MKAKVLLGLSCIVLSLQVFASPAKQETIDKLFEVTQSAQLMDGVYGQMDSMFAQMASQMQIPESQKPIMDKFFKKYSTMMRDEMSWEKIKVPMSNVYAQTYTDEELKDVVKFYQSPTGKKFVAKMPELTKASMVMVQEMMKGFMPKMQALQKELQDELKASQTQNAAPIAPQAK